MHAKINVNTIHFIFENRQKDVIAGINSMSISKLSKVQALAFEEHGMLNGNGNFAIVSDTGTGKTLLYSIAAVNSVDVNNPKVQVLCICATHEGAMQTANVMQRVAIYASVKIGMAVKTARSSYYVFTITFK